IPVSRTIGPSGSGGDGQLIPGGAVGARAGPPCRPAGGCCARTATTANAKAKGTASFIEMDRLFLSRPRGSAGIAGGGTDKQLLSVGECNDAAVAAVRPIF